MAATTPTLWGPVDSATGIRLDDRAIFTWAPYSGAGTLAAVRVRVYDDGSRTTTLWDSLWRGVDGHMVAAQTLEAWPVWWSAAASTAYHWDVAHRNSVSEESSLPTPFSFTTQASPMDPDVWRQSA